MKKTLCLFRAPPVNRTRRSGQARDEREARDPGAVQHGIALPRVLRGELRGRGPDLVAQGDLRAQGEPWLGMPEDREVPPALPDPARAEVQREVGLVAKEDGRARLEAVHPEPGQLGLDLESLLAVEEVVLVAQLERAGPIPAETGPRGRVED